MPVQFFGSAMESKRRVEEDLEHGGYISTAMSELDQTKYQAFEILVPCT